MCKPNPLIKNCEISGLVHKTVVVFVCVTCFFFIFSISSLCTCSHVCNNYPRYQIIKVANTAGRDDFTAYIYLFYYIGNLDVKITTKRLSSIFFSQKIIFNIKRFVLHAFSALQLFSYMCTLISRVIHFEIYFYSTHLILNVM